MSAIRRLVAWLDRLSAFLADMAAWALLLACVMAAGNALLRYVFDIGSNAWLEAQWYLFAAAVMLAAPHLLRLNEHVRVDVIYGGLQPRTKAWVDVLGIALVLLPVCGLVVFLSLDFVHDAYVQHEYSSNAGGLLRWPLKACIPLGFALLALQGLAEAAKRILFLSGQADDACPHYEKPKQ
jgi:TRAP-type mannitol/chloroaromatic compound transport system permease small subunit